ncbi:hypothetical protein HDU97_006201 [Phlyctochytrium planicorne]|nr:hypothetical protein HDU97_006201 [Phlyctochytrium planicorne]
MLAYPLNLNNLTKDLSTYDIPVQYLKSKFDIDLIVDYLPTQQVTDYAGFLGTLLKLNSTEYDIFQIDNIWPGEFGQYFLDVAPYIPEEMKAMHTPGIYKAGMMQGKQVALPLFADYGVLYYRTDLLAKYGYSGPPQTIDEMEEMMSKIVPAEQKFNPSFFGFVGQFLGYEGLTCDLMEWFSANGGGTVVDPYNLTVTVANPNVEEILTRLKSWLSPEKSYSPLASLVYDEGLCEKMSLKVAKFPKIFSNALFVRNWATMYQGTINPNNNFPRNASGDYQFGISRIPGKTRNMSGAALGGFQIAGNKLTKNINATIEAMKALMDPEFQMSRAVVTGVWPTISKLYKDPRLCNYIKFCDVILNLEVVSRPSGATAPYYLAASQELYLGVNKMLRGDVPIPEGLQLLKTSIEKAIKRWVDPTLNLGPPVYVEFNSAAGIIFMSLAGIMAVASIPMFLVIFAYRTHRVLSAASPLFLLIMVGGTFIGHAAVFAYTGIPTNLKCAIQPWLVVCGYSFTMAALISRTWRIFQIFRNTYSMVQISNNELLKTCVYLNVFNIFLLALWTFFNPPVPAIVTLKDSSFWTCQSRNSNTGWTLMGILFVYNAALLAAAIFLTAKTRRVSGPFNESKFVGYAVYTIVLVDVILIPLSNIDAMGATFQYVFRCLAIELSAIAITANMFLPKLITLFGLSELDEHYNVSKSLIKSESFGLKSSLPPSIDHSNKPLSVRKSLIPGGHQGKDGSSVNIVDGHVCARWATSKWALSLASWKSVKIGVVASMKVMFLYMPLGEDAHVNHKEDLGLAVELKDVIMEDFSAYGEEYIFDCIINGVYYQFQVGSSEARQFWVDQLASMVPTLRSLT